MASLQYVDVPGYHALLFRRTYADLAQPEALMSLAAEWLTKQLPRGWDDREKTWHFPTKAEDATLTFGYLEHDKDKYRYQGTSYQFIGWDELTQFPEQHYRFLFGWLRKPINMDVPLRMRGASNPGGVGHEWVKQRFLIEGLQEGRPFIPAKLKDNPHLDPISYRKSMSNLDPVTRAQIEEGDWSARQSGGKFKREWFEIVEEAPADCRKVRFWDMASTEAKKGKDPDWTAGCLMGISSNQTLYLMDMKRLRGTPSSNEQLVKQTAELDGQIPIRMEQEPGSSGVKMIDDYRRRVLMGWDFKGIPSTGSKEVRANPLSSQAEAGNIKLVRGTWINAFLDEAEAFPSGAHDDMVDSASSALAQLTTGNRWLPVEEPEEEKKREPYIIRLGNA
uniref:Putative terminase n=1 Tax=viral metagenome TaxID=1070528 RepID=A0A6M3IRM4_9ZZZZ